LHGPASDLLLGCGGLFTLLFVFFAAAGPAFFTALPLAVPALLVYLVGMPHYGATVVRVYDHRDDRRAYALFTVWATLVIVVVFALALSRPFLASLLLTLHLTWSPWHYAGQNYGIAVMFLLRRGVEVPPFAKRALYLSFMFSFAMVLVLLHLEDPYATPPAREVHLLPIGIPAEVGSWIFGAILACYGTALGVFGVVALRLASLRTLAPALVILLTQMLWHTLPIAMSGFGFDTQLVPLDRHQRAAFFVWIAAGHGIQYLWVTSYYARAAPDWHGSGRYYAKVLAAGTALWTIPTVLFAPHFGLPEISGFFLLLASVVNIHHFVLDGAIWKLRNARVSRVLIRSDVGETDAASDGLARRVGWSVAALGAFAAGALFWVENVSLPKALGEERPVDVVRDLDLLAWFQRDDAGLRLWAARRLEQRGDLDAAMGQYRKSHAIEAELPVLTDLVRIHFDAAKRDSAKRQTLSAVCRELYEQLPEAERIPLPPGVDFSTPEGAGRCYRSAGRWRKNRADELRANAPSAKGESAHLVLGY
jgi:hypothetical protein